VSIEREVFPAMVADRTVFAVDGRTYWIDTGTPAEYVQAQVDLLDGTRGCVLHGVHRTADVDPRADVDLSVIGAGALVGPGARVTRSVLLPGASIAAGAVVDRSIVGEGAEVARDARVTEHCVVGDGGVVPRDARLAGERVERAPEGVRGG
jgi:mannose-1-phosphate guanylyltransferase